MKYYVFDERVKFVTFIENYLSKSSSSKFELTYNGDIFDMVTTENLGNVWHSSTIAFPNCEVICIN
jgi:hypothetical protein